MPWPFALVMTAFIAVVHFGRRHSNTLEVMSGTGDERVRSLYERAIAYAGAVMAWLLLSAIFGASFLVAVVFLARRG